jgi:P4 family phage/plasmid primase-like protien
MDGSLISNALGISDAKMIANGYEPVALDGKRALGTGWPTRPNTEEAIAAERAALPYATNTGARTGRLSVIDVDLIPADHAERIKALAFDVLGYTSLERIGSKGMALCYRNETPIGKITVSGLHATLTHQVSGKAMPLSGKVEILGCGQQLAIYGTHPTTGREYDWPNADLGAEPLQSPLAILPEVTPETLRAMAQRTKALLEELGYRDVTISDATGVKATMPRATLPGGKPLSWERLRERMSYIHPRFDGARPACYPAPSRKRASKPLPYDGSAWLTIALCLRDGNVPLLDDDDHDWIGLIEEWSSGALWYERTGKEIDVTDRWPDQGIAARLQGEARKTGRIAGVATILSYAADGGCPLPPNDEPATHTFAELLSATETTAVATVDSSVIASDDDLTITFANTHRHQLRYVAEWGRWFHFDGRCWVEVKTPAIWNMVRHLVRDYATRLSGSAQPATLRKLLSKPTIANVEALARGAEGVLMPVGIWDTDPWALNTPAGVVDLRTGKLHPSDPLAHCTKMTAVAPLPEGTDLRSACPQWHKFLNDITGGNVELQAFLQRVIGYGLTGLTTEHAMFFFYGTGNNGKGVFIGTVTGILSSYAKTAPVDTFTDTKNDRHPTDIAMLRGARFVAAEETDEGRSWAEAKLKALTGGGAVSARFMHQDFFEYTPLFKLVVAGNHKPRLRNVDEAMRRRLHVVPFQVIIPKVERDPRLSEKLRDEWPGILSWAIQGCLEWQRIGLAPPPSVLDTTQEYFATQDPLADWLALRCVQQAGAFTASADLYADYAHFIRLDSAPLVGREEFCRRLESHGFPMTRHGKGRARGFANVTLRVPANDLPRASDVGG